MNIQTGHKEKFTSLVLHHFDALKRFGFSLCRNEVDADDLVADTLLAAWQNFESLQDGQKAKQWLFRILNNRFISNYRRQKSRATISVQDEGAASFSLFEMLEASSFTDNGNPEKELISRLSRRQIEAAIAALPDEFRITFTLCDVDGFSYQEIAGILHIPVGTVRSRIARARSSLQQTLWKQAQEAGIQVGKKPKEKEGHVCTCGKETSNKQHSV